MTQRVATVRTLAGAVALAVAVSGLAAFAQSQEGTIPSDARGALPPPDAWRCDRIASEYDAWIEAGNSPQSWRYAGQTYRRVDDGRRYSWDDWLAWHGDACVAANARGGNLPDTGLLVGGIVGALGVTALAAGSGGGSGGADSPG